MQYKHKRKILLISIYFLSSIGIAEANQVKPVPDKLIECAAVFGWVYEHSTKQQIKKNAKESVKLYTDIARDLSSEDYVFKTFKNELKEIKSSFYENPVKFRKDISKEIIRCLNVTDVDKDVRIAITTLLKRKNNRKLQRQGKKK